MKQRILIQHPALGANPLELRDLARATFIYGTNGSGKTTLSRCLREKQESAGHKVTFEPPESDRSTDIFVFNRDFIDETISQERLDGVFVLAEGAKSLRAEYQNIERSIDKDKVSLDGVTEKKVAAETRITTAQTRLADVAWTRRETDFNWIATDAFNELFYGSRRNKRDLLAKLLDASPASAVPVTMDDLRERVAVIMDASSTKSTTLAPIPPPPVTDPQIEAYLGDVPSLGNASNLAALIEKYGLTDWFAQGLRHAAEMDDGKCPFCRQSISDVAMDELSSVIGGDFERIAAQARNAHARLTEWHNQASSWTQGAIKQAQAELDSNSWMAFRAASEALRETSARALAALAEKASNPSVTPSVTPLTNYVVRLTAYVSAINNSIHKRNSLIDHRSAERDRLRSDVLIYLKDALKSDLETYDQVVAEARKDIEGCQSGSKRLSDRIARSEEALQRINEQLTSSADTAKRINTLLNAVGFDNFSLAQDLEESGYVLIRQDGSTVGSTLSEGEATFVALLYFIQKVRSLSTDPKRRDTPLIALVDDPVSSLDSSVAHYVSILLKDLAAETMKGDSRLSQLIVLTHNAFFYRQVSLNLPRELGEHTAYGVLRRQQAGRSYESSKAIPVRSSYALLWNEVPDEQEIDKVLAPSTQNCMRRIVETYFTSFGEGYGVTALADKFEGQERIQFASLTSWLHSGSHSIFDEFEYSPTEGDSRAFLAVFKKLFEETGNMGHYNMMMEGRRRTKSEDSER